MAGVSWPKQLQLVLLAVAGFLWIEHHIETVVAQTTDNHSEDTNSEDADNSKDEFVCGVYVAPSTLPGTGLGMYAGPKGFSTGEMITKSLGDHVIALVDQKQTHSDTNLYDANGYDMTKFFLWDQYTWNSGAFGINIEHLGAHDVEVASPGFGAAANSFMDFVNVEEGGVDFGLLPADDTYEIHRSKDPGAGAFTQYHTRKAWAKQAIAPNAEFFVSYGDSWFVDRAWRLGTIPVTGDHDAAEDLYKKFHNLFLGANYSLASDQPTTEPQDPTATETNEEEPRHPPTNDQHQQPPQEVVSEELSAVYREFWDTLVADFSKHAWQESRIFAALPQHETSDLYPKMLDKGYKAVKSETMRRSQEWLEEHGICADAVRIGRSTLPNQQAGHGAFANTQFQKGQAVMAAPLIHIPDKAVLDTFFKYEHSNENNDFDEGLNEDATDYDVIHQHSLGIGMAKTGEQLLLNYVFGHRDSTMVLSPYGPGVQLINHNQTQANVRLQWAESHRSNHNHELLQSSVEEIRNQHYMGSVLGLEIVATRDIRPDEELFLDYGDEWEEAWNKHVARWNPPDDSTNYVSAAELNYHPKFASNSIPDMEGLRGGHELLPNSVRLMVNRAWKDDKLRQTKGDDYITEQLMWEDFSYDPVETIFQQPPTSSPLAPDGQEKDDDTTGATVDDTLYTVLVKVYREYDIEAVQQARAEGRSLPEFELKKIRDVPRRGVKFEDLSYTTDQFLENAFREYIRIPDDIFPEAWKNLKTSEAKEWHYWRYRRRPNGKLSWYDEENERYLYHEGEQQQQETAHNEEEEQEQEHEEEQEQEQEEENDEDYENSRGGNNDDSSEDVDEEPLPFEIR